MKAGFAFAAVLVSSMVLNGAVAFGDASTGRITALNKKLQELNAGWVARENALTGLDEAEVKSRLGLRLDRHPEVRFEVPEKMSLLRASRLDWRDRGGQNWLSPVLDQGHCGSCVAFASIGVLESQYKISSGFPGLNVKFSPQYLFSCGGGMCDWGWTPGEAARFIKTNGVPDEACLPYTSGAAGEDIACKQACADSGKRSVHLADFSTPTQSAKNLDDIKKALEKGPLVTTLSVYEDFMAYSSGVYKHVTGKYLGGHAVSIVGYDDNDRAFVVRNSWGEDWGEHGFIRISYDDSSGIGEDTWGYDLTAGKTVSIQSPRDQTYATSELPIHLFAPEREIRKYALNVLDTKGAPYWSGTTQSDLSLDISKYPDGRYELVATALDGSGNKVAESQHRYFYVMNTKPALSLNYAFPSGTDLAKPLKGDIMLTLTSQSSTVPLEEIEFHYQSVASGDKTKAASMPASPMTMKWKTALIKDGDYEIWFVGKMHSESQSYEVSTAHQIVHVKN